MKQPPPNDNYSETINGITFNMIFVEGGDVWIENGNQTEKQKITVPNFHIAETQTTQELWRAIMGEDPKRLRFKGDQRPVERVSWDDIVRGTAETNGKAFLDELNAKSKYSNYKLPSEAIWQFAAQGGNKSEGYLYSGSNNLKEVGWFRQNSHRETKPVKLKLPNELGLYDMTGNVWEWCADIWTEDVKTIPVNGLPNNEKNNNKNTLRVVRGGSSYDSDYDSRVAYRGGSSADFRDYDLGLRLSRY